MKMWLDDIRPEPFPPRDHRAEYPFDRYAPYDIVCLTADEALGHILRGVVTFISFDHDLGQGKTGYDVARFIEEGAHNGTIKPIHYKVHSANPVGSINIKIAMDNAWRTWGE